MKKNIFTLLIFLFIASWFVSCEDKTPPADITDSSTNTTSDVAPRIDDEAIKDDYRNTNRMIWQKPDLVIEFMGDISDKVIADIGAGTGFFSFPLARKAKKVIAIDVDPGLVNYLDSAKVMELPEYAQDRLEARLTPEEDPSLEAGEADIILMVNTYLYIRQKNGVAYLQKIKDALPEGGSILIIDFKKKKLSRKGRQVRLSASQEVRVPLYQVELDLEEAGFQQIESDDKSLDFQYIVKATK